MHKEDCKTIGDYVEWLAELPDTEAMMLYAEVAKKYSGVSARDIAGAVKKRRRDIRQEKLQQERAENKNQTLFEVGSNVEIATHFAKSLNGVVYYEGSFWVYDQTEWVDIPQNQLHKMVQGYDRLLCGDGSARIKLDTNKIKSIITETSILLERGHFFADAPTGINCLSGFITFANDGAPLLVPHSPDHRARHTLQANWISGTPVEMKGSKLEKFLLTMFKYVECGDQYIDLIQQVCGVVVAEYATKLKQPKSLMLVGAMANNGKSTLLNFIRSLLPKSAVSTISPSKFVKQEYLIELAGKLLNTSDELSSSALESDVFKSLIDGKSDISARSLYQKVTMFRSKALHIYATQQPPKFFGGIDKGVRRRVVIIDFPISIPEKEMILDIDQQIITEEMDLYMAWAVDGASYVIANQNYTLPDNAASMLDQWAKENDTVQDFIASRERRINVEHRDNQWTKFQLYQQNLEWGKAYEFKHLVEKYEFYRRFQQTFPELDVYGRKSNDRHTIKGIMILRNDDDDRYTVRNPDYHPANNKEYTDDIVRSVKRMNGDPE